jgi:hypothetical protein
VEIDDMRALRDPALCEFIDSMFCSGAYGDIVRRSWRANLVRTWPFVGKRQKPAPYWAGFSAERSSKELVIHVQNVARPTTEFLEEIDRCDAE